MTGMKTERDRRVRCMCWLAVLCESVTDKLDIWKCPSPAAWPVSMLVNKCKPLPEPITETIKVTCQGAMMKIRCDILADKARLSVQRQNRIYAVKNSVKAFRIALPV